MNREIKFRAWDKNISKMTEPLSLETMAGKIHGRTLARINPDDLIWMQFTGLKDKNGKEIYEGDIVRGDYHWKEPIVVDDLPSWFHEHIEYGSEPLEVIGNIYESPELLS